MDADQDDVAAAIREQVTPTVIDRLSATDDPGERARRAVAITDAVLELRDAVSRARRNALVEMNEAGASWAEIGRVIGTSAGRAYQIVHGKNRPQRPT